jgi:exodeoxyribonuclease V beta subunit
LKSNGFDGEPDKAWHSVCADWVMDALESNLSVDPNTSIKLRGISDGDKLVEMEFYFPLQKPVSAGAINRLLRDYGYLLPGQPLLEFSELHGMMKGFIDLTFTHQGKCYLLDYKSNHLGNSITDYEPEKLPDAIRASRYDLQYLIYTVALHRYLTSRIDGYRYETHFGGVFYLYLRGMSRDSAHHGVYFDKPAQDLIEALDALFGNDSISGAAS